MKLFGKTKNNKEAHLFQIENAAFVLNGRQYHLDKNEGENCNHSGFHGFHKRMWTA